MARLCPLLPLLALPLTRAATTIYQVPGRAAFATGSAAAAASAYTGAAAYNPTTLVAPPVPTPAVPSSLCSRLPRLPTLGEKGGSRDGKLTKAAVGKNATHIQVPFLNLMANIQQRAGSVRVRVGGNSQESATLVPASSIPDGKILQKHLTGVRGTTQPRRWRTMARSACGDDEMSSLLFGVVHKAPVIDASTPIPCWGWGGS
ncbi:hypothetical protein B0H13DRAFT_2536207 [Mycena leptocephala]|nr:hypothetical protein B0H13DRAFT_2536207 [Mycena leptocephala]